MAAFSKVYNRREKAMIPAILGPAAAHAPYAGSARGGKGGWAATLAHAALRLVCRCDMPAS